MKASVCCKGKNSTPAVFPFAAEMHQMNIITASGSL
jgi:hypothetical protein